MPAILLYTTWMGLPREEASPYLNLRAVGIYLPDQLAGENDHKLNHGRDGESSQHLLTG
jgi:hypothetical protein